MEKKKKGIWLKVLVIVGLILILLPTLCIGSFYLYIYIQTVRSTHGYIPEVRGKVVDALTKKPIPDAYIRAQWVGGHPDLNAPWIPFLPGIYGGDLVEKTYSLQKGKTNQDGRFYVMPKSRKLERLRLLQREIPGDLYITVAALGYNLEILEIKAGSERPPKRETTAGLRPLVTGEEWWRKIWQYKSPSHALTDRYTISDIPDQLDFRVRECELFVERFPASPHAAEALLISADISRHKMEKYPENPDLKSQAINQYRKIIEMFPASTEAHKAKSTISYLENQKM